MVVGDQCGFPSNYYPAHAPLGFPQCLNYKGTQSQRIADLKRRGSGTYQISEWNKWYEDKATAVRVDAVIRQRMAVVDSERAAEAAIQLQREQIIYDAGVAESQRLQKVAEDKRLQQIKDQEITFNEQVNSGDFNETPITDVNFSSGCSECTGTEISSDPILRKGYHTMPDGSLMKDSDMEKKPLNNNMKFAGIAAAGVIGLLLYSKGGLK
tara:strand:- start:12 stop:644 length:633 start_codon:yes stop_codon:yes gene_type:complete